MERLRMCIACKRHLDKSTLYRVVKSPEGIIFVDKTGKASGRGAYVCSKECMLKIQKSRLLNRAFKCEVKPEVYDALSEMML